ncbi:MAG: Rpp14/Pop5 family protein [Candidatus Woesearchaeota archaeon]
MKQKPLLPSLREKKRYLVYEVLSDQDFDAVELSGSIKDNYSDLYGVKGVSEAGLLFPKGGFDKKRNRGIIRVADGFLDELRSSFVFISGINGKNAIVRSVIATGMMKRAKEIMSAS